MKRYSVELDLAGALATAWVCPACDSGALRAACAPSPDGAVICSRCGAEWMFALGRAVRVGRPGTR